jgi:predicted phosphoribosyltransferase
MQFHDRTDAGRQLAARLTEYANRSDVIVLALPRGGVPVAFEVAAKLSAPLDVFLVRKLGVPGHPELAMGAIAAGGVEVLSEDLIRDLAIPQALVRQVAVRERLELDRRDRAYRDNRPPPIVRDRTVILIDDGLATGSTMQAAVLAVRQQAPAKIVVAVPVGARETCERLARLADRVICFAMPEPFNAVGLWYQDFGQTSDEEVGRLLAAAGRQPAQNPSRSTPKADPVDIVRRRAVRLAGDPSQYDALLAGIGDVRIVLLGEATHGTHEFYPSSRHAPALDTLASELLQKRSSRRKILN